MGLFKRKTAYQKDCEKRIDELCGGFFYNDAFKNRAALYKDTTSLSNDFEKSVLKHECEEGKLMIEDIESRLDELLQLDCETLDITIRSNRHQDTSRFKTQEDIERFLGPEYVMEYNRKNEEKIAKRNIRRVEVDSKYDFSLGVDVRVRLPSIGLKINCEFADVFSADEFNTKMIVANESVVFKNSLSDLNDLLIPFTLILSIERSGNGYIDINLVENQTVQLSFIIDEVWSHEEVKTIVEENFLNILDGSGDAKSNENVCSGCGASVSAHDKFCPVCGRNL